MDPGDEAQGEDGHVLVSLTADVTVLAQGDVVMHGHLYVPRYSEEKDCWWFAVSKKYFAL